MRLEWRASGRRGPTRRIDWIDSRIDWIDWAGGARLGGLRRVLEISLEISTGSHRDGIEIVSTSRRDHGEMAAPCCHLGG